MGDKLKEYIKKREKAGDSKQEIKKKLLQAGWDEEKIDATLKSTFTLSPPILITAAVVLVAAAAITFLITQGTPKQQNGAAQEPLLNKTNTTERTNATTKGCGDNQTCFEQHLKDCRRTNATIKDGPIKIKERILREEGKDCTISMTYVGAPEGFDNKSMECTIPKGRREGFREYLQGEVMEQECTGPLADYIKENREPAPVMRTSECNMEEGFGCTDYTVDRETGFVLLTIQNRLGEELSNATIKIRDKSYQCPSADEFKKITEPVQDGAEIANFTFGCNQIRENYVANITIEYHKAGENTERTAEGFIEG